MESMKPTPSILTMQLLADKHSLLESPVRCLGAQSDLRKLLAWFRLSLEAHKFDALPISTPP